MESSRNTGVSPHDAARPTPVSAPSSPSQQPSSASSEHQQTLVEGEVELLKYSTFALSDGEREQGGILLCRSLPQEDLVIELLNFDEELLSKSIVVRSFAGVISGIEKLTHDIWSIEIDLEEPIKFWAGQYVDITVRTKDGETISRSFSMANTPDQGKRLQFIVKKYPDGKFSNELDAAGTGGITVGAEVTVQGPYGTCFRREDRTGELVLVAAGSGMSPIWSILNDHIASGEVRPVKILLRGTHPHRSVLSRSVGGDYVGPSRDHLHAGSVARFG